jgi:hypothetical protein
MLDEQLMLGVRTARRRRTTAIVVGVGACTFDLGSAVVERGYEVFHVQDLEAVSFLTTFDPLGAILLTTFDPPGAI